MRLHGLGMVAGALLVVASAGCGGGACEAYCEAARDCALDQGNSTCSDADIEEGTDICVSACEDGLGAVDADARGDMEACLDCVAGIFAEQCELDDSAILECQEPCLAAGQLAFEAFGEAFEQASEDAELPACFGSSASSCDLSKTEEGSSVTCSVDCGDFAAACAGTAGEPASCTCTSGARAGEGFSAPCEALDESVAAELCS